MNDFHSIYVIGESRTNIDNAITKIYGSFYMAFEVDENTYEVLDFSCTHTVATTENFLKKLFLGQNFMEIDKWIVEEIELRYGGSSRKAVVVAYKDALKRWEALRGRK